MYMLVEVRRRKIATLVADSPPGLLRASVRILVRLGKPYTCSSLKLKTLGPRSSTLNPKPDTSNSQRAVKNM